jgi:hypothetical protein
MPGDRNLLSLDASLAIPTRVLRFEASWHRRPGRSDRPPWAVRLAREIWPAPGGLTAPPERLNRHGWPHLLVESSASVLWLNRVTQWFSGEPLQTPRTRCSLCQSPLMTWLPRSPGSTLVLRLDTWRPHRQRPFTLVLHLHQHESSRNLHLQYLAKNQSTQSCQPLITQGSDHPPVLEPHMVLTHHFCFYRMTSSTSIEIDQQHLSTALAALETAHPWWHP